MGCGDWFNSWIVVIGLFHALWWLVWFIDCGDWFISWIVVIGLIHGLWWLFYFMDCAEWLTHGLWWFVYFMNCGDWFISRIVVIYLFIRQTEGGNSVCLFVHTSTFRPVCPVTTDSVLMRPLSVLCRSGQFKKNKNKKL